MSLPLKELPEYLPPRDKKPSSKKSYKYIPKKIFQTYKTNQVSSGMYDAVNTWIDKNPDWEYHFFDKDDRRNFIKENFPKKVLDAYDTLLPGAYKADLWRYCVLYIHGGVYVDIKAQLLVSLNDVISEDIQFLSIKDKLCDSPSSLLSTYIL
jgi:mannosyltransferase OCH1-like enzyme